jgi:hypothetical protein
MTFLEAWELSRSIKESHNDAAIGAIFTGINVAEDFWDNFILVCNNKEGLAALLNISPEKVASWPPAIQKHLEQAKSQKNPESKEKTHIIDTGVGNVDI